MKANIFTICRKKGGGFNNIQIDVNLADIWIKNRGFLFPSRNLKTVCEPFLSNRYINVSFNFIKPEITKYGAFNFKFYCPKDLVHILCRSDPR